MERMREIWPGASLIATALACCTAFGIACGVDRSAPLDAADMQVQVATALRDPETVARTVALVRLLEQLEPGNVAGAAAAVDERLTVIEESDLQLFLHAWAAFDTQAALDHALAWPLKTKREFGAGKVIYYWAWRDGASDAKFNLDSLVESDVRKSARSELVKGWTRSGDYEGVTAYVSELPHGDLRDRYSAIVVAAIVANEGSDGAMAWADGVPEDANDNFKRTAFLKALRHVSARDPEQGAAWYEQQADQPYSNLGMSVVATEWIERDPESTFAWLGSQPVGGQRDLAMRFAMRRWLATDPDSAGVWMRSGDRSGEFAPTLDTYALWLAQHDPAEAVQWGARVPDETQSAKVLIAAGRRWRARDPEAFQAWLADAELPESTRTALERRRGDGPVNASVPAAGEEPGE